MSKGQAKIEISDILTKFEIGTFTMCEVGREIARVLDVIYADQCTDHCLEGSNCKDIC